MKEFQILRYLKKYHVVIAALSVMMGIIFYYGAGRFLQSYTAAAVIEYTNKDASLGMAPDGTQIDPTELYGSNIISQVIKNLGLDPETTSVDLIRSGISIEPIITEEQKLTQESQIGLGFEYELHPTQYIVSFTTETSFGKEYPRRVLNEILNVYSAYYGQEHVNSSGGFNAINDIYTKGYDYIEMLEVIDSSLDAVLETLEAKSEVNDEFRSYETGYSFRDLYREFDLLQSIEVADLTADILNQKITKDRDVLLAKYRERNNAMSIENGGAVETISKLQGIIDSYVEMMSDSGNTNITAEYILDELYASYRYDEDGNWVGRDKTTEYDQLLNGYVNNRVQYENNLIDTVYNQYVIEVFTEAEAFSPEELCLETEARIQELVAKTDALYAIFRETNDEYNRYLGAANVALLSSAGVSEKIPLGLFTLFVVILFGGVGCVGAIILGRVEDIVEYYAFTNKLDGLPNRAKCDRYLAKKEKELLSGAFTCIVLKITNLQEENRRLGRSAGDQMMKTFSQTLTSVFMPSDQVFVGYNGSGQYLVFADELTQSHAEASLSQLRSVIAEKCGREEYWIEFSAGMACAETEKCYYIRRLLSKTMQRLAPQENKPLKQKAR